MRDPRPRALEALLVQCARSATIWVSGCARNPYFVILGASLLFDNWFLMLLPHWGYGGFECSPIFTHFHMLFCSFAAHSLSSAHYVHMCVRCFDCCCVVAPELWCILHHGGLPSRPLSTTAWVAEGT